MSKWTRPQMTEAEITYQIEWYKNEPRKGWLSNTDSFYVELISRLIELGFTIGPPQGNEKYSDVQAAKDGLVGVYHA